VGDETAKHADTFITTDKKRRENDYLKTFQRSMDIKFDNTKSKLSEATGITFERMREIREIIVKVSNSLESKSLSTFIETIANHKEWRNDAELVFALYSTGEMVGDKDG
jgi:uncharacterized protein YprB with RNaseH-like and TPR domain